MSAGLPTGTVTFLFTDIEGSTKRWEARPDAMRAALARHDDILREAVEAQGGHVFKTVGDAFCAAFADPTNALNAAIIAQQGLHSADWEGNVGVLVRMALHTGVVESQGGDYYGQPLNRIARLMSAGHGGQILLSQPAYELVRDNLPTGVQLRDMGEHRLKDLIRPEHIYQVLAKGLPTEFPPLRTLDYRPNNLPAQPTALIGREKELAGIGKLLGRDDVRLITLTGPGGIGKTRIALQVSADMLDNFADGIWFVDLSPVLDPKLVISTIAQTFEVQEAAGDLLLARVTTYLKEKQLLLLLDNFEQVSSAAPMVGVLLAACARLKMLVTSRVPLRVRGEKELPVSPLSLPNYRNLPPLERLTQYEAVHLFIERARDIRPDFEVNNDNAPAVAEICARLDGLPLAIELAAARIRLFSPQALLPRLTNRLQFLTGGATNLPTRQQTLFNTMEWSYDLLSPGEQQFFRRIAVFQGGRTIEAVEALCNSDRLGDDGQVGMDVLQGIEGLIQGSLLQRREGAGGETRFWMLETIHEYARRKLDESGEAAALQREHALYFVKLAEEAQPYIRGARQVEWLDKLEEEHDNFRAALRWALDRGQVLVALIISGDISEFWLRRGHHTEGWNWLTESVSMSVEQQEDIAEPIQVLKAARAKALLGASRLANRRNDDTSATLLAKESLAIYTELGDKSGMASAIICSTEPDIGLEVWQARMEDVIKLAGAVGDTLSLGQAIFYLGDNALLSGDYTTARSRYTAALEVSRKGGHRPLTALILVKLAGIARSIGDYTTALAQYEESLGIYRELRDRWTSTYALGNMGALAHEQGDDERAQAVFEETLALGREFGAWWILAAMLGNLGALHFGRGEYDLARTLVEEGVTVSRTMGYEETISMQLYLLGRIEQQQGNFASAMLCYKESLEKSAGQIVVHGFADPGHEVVSCLTSVASIRLAQGRARRAATILGAEQGLKASLTKRIIMEGAVQSTLANLEYESTARNTRDQLSDEEWEEALAEGRAMTMEQAITYALEGTDE